MIRKLAAGQLKKKESIRRRQLRQREAKGGQLRLKSEERLQRPREETPQKFPRVVKSSGPKVSGPEPRALTLAGVKG